MDLHNALSGNNYVGQSLMIWNIAVPSAQAAPTATMSHYISSQNLYNLGLNKSNTGGVIILMFGAPAYNPWTGEWGTYDYSSTFRSVTTIKTNVQDFIAGYTANSSHTAQIVVGLGTSNYILSPFNPYHLINSGDYSAHGSKWREITGTITQNQLATVEAANDMEIDTAAGWGDGTVTRTWLDGFIGNTAYRHELVYDFGDMAGGANPEPGWTTEQKWYKIYGCSPCWPFPQIYYQPQAPNNQKISEWSYDNKGYKIWFSGVMSQDGSGTGVTQSSGNLSTADSYNALINALAVSQKTIQSAIDYLSWIW